MGAFRSAALAGLVTLACLVGSSSTAQSVWQSRPWIDDLHQIRQAVEARYANLDWLIRDREVDLDKLFARAETRLAAAGSDAEAHAIVDRLMRGFGDGHVEIHWPKPPMSASVRTVLDPIAMSVFCKGLGYDASRGTAGLGVALAGYRAVGSGDVLPAGVVPVGAARLGIVRIPVFQPQANPALCAESVRALAVPIDRPCDDSCGDRIETDVYARFTAIFDQRLRALKAAGATIVMVDITGDGGGSEWAEAAARMLTRRRLLSERTAFVRGAHWIKHWRELGDGLRGFARKASLAIDRRDLLIWARQADAARRDAEVPCAIATGCAWLGRAGFATGLVGQARAGAFDGKPWGPFVFSPSQFRYEDGVWDGPVIVLVDQETWSAAEEFASVLQDNRAAIILGSRTGGAGCGHTAGGTPTVLRHSGATLELPDCVRLRADGSNEVAGVIPDHVLPWRADDGAGFRTKMLQPVLPQAMRQAEVLYHRGHR